MKNVIILGDVCTFDINIEHLFELNPYDEDEIVRLLGFPEELIRYCSGLIPLHVVNALYSIPDDQYSLQTIADEMDLSYGNIISKNIGDLSYLELGSCGFSSSSSKNIWQKSKIDTNGVYKSHCGDPDLDYKMKITDTNNKFEFILYPYSIVGLRDMNNLSDYKIARFD
ncbi:MAG: hypothetical protein CMP21_03950 [Rickettsiales bacterium]|nr:hypothetical protein [Rickettsiales bacterium]|tara:strand:- start:8352 stop:8858 length:507 start_codon:yes stop_codon:yes gene_type:complete